jgi:hypothetical protein
VLPELTADDLKELDVVAVGHRRLLLNAIAALRTDDGAAVTGAPALLTRSAEAERRVHTVMFCDLVGSTPLSARLDPEDLRMVIAAYHSSVAASVARFGGVVAKYKVGLAPTGKRRLVTALPDFGHCLVPVARYQLGGRRYLLGNLCKSRLQL